MTDSTPNQPENIALFYTEGSSDKEYRVQLREEGNGLWMVLGFNGRRGSTLKEQKKTQVPVDYATAKKEYDKIVRGKMKDGYTPDQSGAVYQSTDMAERFSGVVPQLLNSLRQESKVEAFINDPRQVGQEKHDGERRPIRADTSKVDGINKEGIIVSLPVSVAATIQSLASQLLVDGEIMGERFVAFDLLELNNQDLRALPYEERLEKLTELFEAASDLGTVELVYTARTTEEKRRLFNALRDHKAEGMVFKDSQAPYSPSRPASGGAQHKFKFTEDCSVRVSALNSKKRSVSIECRSEDGLSAVPLGNVTIPPKSLVPAVGDIVKVNYLYLYSGGSLFQPTYLGSRTDQSQPDTLDQFKLKSTEIFVMPDAEQTVSAKAKRPSR